MNTNSTPAKVTGSVVRHTVTGGGIAGLLSAQDEILQVISLLVTVIGLGWSIWEKLRRPTGNVPARNGGKSLVGAFALCLLTSALCIPAVTGCASATRDLDPAGVYQGDSFLAGVDEFIIEVDNTYDEFLALAGRNQAVVDNSKVLQEIVTRINKERDGLYEPDELLGTLMKARDAYVARPTPENGTQLQSQLAIARVGLKQIRDLLPALLPATSSP